MIPIHHPDISSLAKTYATILMGYLNSPKRRIPLSDYDREVSRFFAGETFESILLSNASRQVALVQTWNTGRHGKKTHFSRFLNLYNALNREGEFNLPDGTLRSLAHYLVEKLDTVVCNYCNRNYNYNISNRRTSELDHYYPKTEFPFLAVSFFNLIPSCHTCNHVKGTKRLRLLNPHDTAANFDAIRFSYQLKSCSGAYSADEIDLLLETGSTAQNDRTMLADHKLTLELDKLYSKHKDVVVELIQKRLMYTDEYLNDLRKDLTLKGIASSPEDFLRLITGNYVDKKRIGLRPLAKLNMDICTQLKFL